MKSSRRSRSRNRSRNRSKSRKSTRRSRSRSTRRSGSKSPVGSCGNCMICGRAGRIVAMTSMGNSALCKCPNNHTWSM